MSVPLTNNFISFKDILEKISIYVEQLVELENQKYEVLTQLEIKRLMEINSREDEITHEIDILEQQRKNSILKLSYELGFDSGITLSEMITYFPLSLQDELHRIRHSIKENSRRLEIIMRENSYIIQANLEIINFTLSFANRSADLNTYQLSDKNHTSQKSNDLNLHIVNHIA